MAKQRFLNLDLARATDPETSKQAAHELGENRTTAAAWLFRAIERANSVGIEPTAMEAATRCVVNDPQRNAETYRKRIGDIRHLLEVTGTRCCRITGKRARTFKIKQQQETNLDA